MKKIEIKIWSDLVCPFCYIGKRRLEKAIANLTDEVEIRLEWKSFQLDPSVESDASKTVYEYLAERYGRSLEWSKQSHEQVTKMAAGEGLEYHFERAKISNSWDAHRLIKLASADPKQDALVERLFKGHFSNGESISDVQFLVNVAKEVGLNLSEIEKFREANSGSAEVKRDILEARQIGISGVPFFLFNNKYAVSGAQSEAHFMQVLKMCLE